MVNKGLVISGTITALAAATAGAFFVFRPKTIPLNKPFVVKSAGRQKIDRDILAGFLSEAQSRGYEIYFVGVPAFGDPKAGENSLTLFVRSTVMEPIPPSQWKRATMETALTMFDRGVNPTFSGSFANSYR